MHGTTSTGSIKAIWCDSMGQMSQRDAADDGLEKEIERVNKKLGLQLWKS